MASNSVGVGVRVLLAHWKYSAASAFESGEPRLNSSVRLVSSSSNCVESRGIMNTGTPLAKSFCAAATSHLMLYSGSGPRSGL